MKKLLSICFLSILLGLLSFSTRAQGGFWIENMQPDTIFGVANYSPNNDGKLPLTHTLGNAYFNPLTGNFVGNANVGVTQLYKLNLCDWDSMGYGKKKVSIDWQLYRDGQLVNDNLSDYVEFSIYTLYRKLNANGEFLSIHWLGGRVIDGYGTCTAIPAQDIFSSPTCTDPTNYPGALQVEQGTPFSVLTQLGQIVPAQGLFSIYTESLDYFYADFLEQTDNYVQIKWLQPGNYTLVMSIRERIGGTDWNNLTWNLNETTDFIGGHQSCCGEILASDTLSFPILRDTEKAVCENVSWDFGRPTYTFNAPVGGVYPNVSYDTMIVFGEIVGTGDCAYFQVDSLYNVDFFVRHTPVVTVQSATLCRCETLSNLLSLVTEDTVGLAATQSSHELQWKNSSNQWKTTPVYRTKTVNAAGDTVYTYVVRQVNTYDDTLTCTGPEATFTVTFKEMLAPVANVPAVLDFCREAVDSTTTFTATADLQDSCGTTTRWYTKFLTTYNMNFGWLLDGTLPTQNYFTSYIDKTSLIPGADLSVNLKQYLPVTNHDTTIVFFVTSYDPVTGCESPKFDYIMVNIHQTPELSKHILKTVYCPSDEVEMFVSIINNPPNTDAPYTYLWTGVTSIDDSNAVALPASLSQVVEVSHNTISGSTQQTFSDNNPTRMPVLIANGRNYSQQIFTPAEVPAGIITKLAFDYASNTALTKKSSDVEIYLTTTDKNSFTAQASEFVTSDLVLVYSGSLNATKGWNEYALTNPYTYTGEKNLLLVVKDNSGETQSKCSFNCSTTGDYKSLLITTDGVLPTDPTTYTGSVNRYKYRSDVKFTVAPLGQATTNTFQFAYNQLNPDLECGHVYTTTAIVIDSNGCTSQPVEFTYIANDTIYPVVAPLARETRVQGCNVSASNTKSYKTLAELIASGVNVTDDAVEVGDNCGFQFLTMTYDSVFFHGSCEDTLKFIYTIKDKCGKTAQFIDWFISRDSVAPQFRLPSYSPYVRINPVPAGNCTFNSPDSSVFVAAVAPYVYDDCTDSADLMNTLVFNWENINNHNDRPIGATDIFREHNHLTVTATITDKCGNSTTSLVIYLDRPDSLKIAPNAIVSSGNLCFKDTLSLEFLTDHIIDDTIVGPFTPYSYAWSEVSGKPVNFTAANGIETKVTFPEAGDYVFVMTVTDANGCDAVSQPVAVNVRPLPQMAIQHIVINGQDEPYCPTYGNLTLAAVQLNPQVGQTIGSYLWSGESVNIFSTNDTSWVTIVPEWCDTVYYPTVTVKDDRGCVGSVTDTVEVAATGPVFHGTLADTTVQKQPGCLFFIPDFKNLITADIVKDDCYTFSQLKYYDAYGTIERADWYSQSPAAGDTLTESSKVVTITIKNPCGKTNTITVNVLKPAEVLAVTIDPTDTAGCQFDIQNSGVTYVANPANAYGTVSYEWTVNGNTTVLGTDAAYLVQALMNAGTYTYQVDIEDGLGCTASATANLEVYFQGADPIIHTWPNTLCDRYNGMLAVDTAPRGYAYLLESTSFIGYSSLKISDVPAHLPVDWTTIVFDSLRNGTYQLTVFTDDGCERIHSVTINDVSASPAAPTFTTVNPTVCSNDNGELHINAKPGFTYELYPVVGGVQGALIGTANDYNTLSTGYYLIHAIEHATMCTKDTNFTLIDNATRPHPSAIPTANNNCTNDQNKYTGKLNITTNANWKYTVYTESNDTLLNNVTLTSTNNPITGLKQGKYYISAYDPATTCYSLAPDTFVTIQYQQVNTPLYASAPTSNHFCKTDTADGVVKLVNGTNSTNLTNFLSYNLVKTSGDTIRRTADYNNGWSSLYDGTYQVKATNKYYCNVTPVSVTVKKDTIVPVLAATSTMNTSCVDELGTITITNTNKTAMNVAKYGNAKIASYKIVNGSFQADTATNASPVTFANLASGTYTYNGISNYGCKSVDSVIVVDQYQLPAMDLDSTPNHMCAPTFEKPGDGTITINVPTNTSNPGHTYEYKFYDAAGHEMTVPYDLPLTHTKYWLSAQKYKVRAYEPSTGCEVWDSITVENEFYTVDFDYTTAPNFFCDTNSGNGMITVINPTSTDPDAVFAYSLDDVTYTSNNVFTGLKTGIYTVYVKDTVMACVMMKNVEVNTTDSCAPIITICDTKGDCGDRFDYCYGEENIMLKANAVDTCNGATFSYEWYAPCADPNSSDSASISVQTDHYVVNGCDYILTVTNNLTGCKYIRTVNVAIHPNPILGFTINGSTADIAHTNPFCETEELEITLTSDQPLDTASITWTLGKVGTGFTSFKIKGDTIANDSVTFCVYAYSKYGCRSTTASLPVNFKRVAHETVTATACGTYTVAGTTISLPTGETYPYTTTFDKTYTSVVTGCDSIVTYNITLNGAPEINPASVTVAPFCETEGYTLANFVDSFNVKSNGATTTTKWMAGTGTGTYTLVTDIADLTDGEYIITNATGTVAMQNTSNSSNSSVNYATPDFTTPSSDIIWNITKNSDNTYSIYNVAADVYVYLNTGSSNSLSLGSMTGNKAKWVVNSITADGATVSNKNWTNRYLKYNPSSLIFRCYESGQELLNFYKKSVPAYSEVPATTVVDYAFATANNVKYVAMNECDTVEASITFNVSKKPAIDSFDLKPSYCNDNDCAIKFVASAYTNPATATLKLDGVTVGTYAITTENQECTYNFHSSHAAHNGKSLVLTVANNNGLCGDTVATKTLVIDTTILNTLVAPAAYCAGDTLKYSDFTSMDFTGLTGVTLNKVPSGTFADNTVLAYGDNTTQVYFTMYNTCGNLLTTNNVTITVNDKPSFTGPANVDVCADAFALTAPTDVDGHGSAIVAQGWLMETAAGQYAPATPDAIKAAARDSVVNAAYYAKNSCDSVAETFTVLVNDKPEVTLTAAMMCPNATIASALTSTVNYHNISNPSLNTDYYEIAKADGTDRVTLNTADAFSVYYPAYQGGMIYYIADNNICGSDTAEVTINMVYNDFTTFTFKAACKGSSVLSDFIDTLPLWTGTAVVDAKGWTVDGVNVPNPGAYPVTHEITVGYYWKTTCGDSVAATPKTLTDAYLYTVPVVNIDPTITKCVGDTIKFAETNLNVTFHGNEELYDTVWTLGGVAYDFNTPLTAEDNGKALVVAIQEKAFNTTCGNATDTMIVVVNPLPVVTVSGPATVCENVDTVFTATPGFVNYVFTVESTTLTATPSTQDDASNTFTTQFSLGGIDGVGTAVVNVVATDANGCKASAATGAEVVVTNMPQFVFYNADSTVNDSHSYTGHTGQPITFGWMIGTKCNLNDKLVYVEYDIYHNDTLIADAKIGQYLDTRVENDGMTTYYWVTKNTISWLSGTGVALTNSALYNYAIANPSAATSGNHFPYTNLGLDNYNVYDDFWMHFIGDRIVKADFAPFRISGDYKVVYRLYSTTHEDDFMHVYTEDNADHPNYNSHDQHIGGHNAFTAHPTLTLLAIDSISIAVDGPNYAAPATDEHPAPAPQVAPALTLDETQVVPDMEVWPNPAPAVTTTLKARVHNMNGNATVTLTNLTGKQVYTGNVYIDNDNFYFEFNVNSLTVGSYIMTVRTATDVITKKVIVAPLAH